MGKENVLLIHNGILVRIKKQILCFVTAWMELEIIMLSEISKVQKDKYYMFSLTCGNQKKVFS
jgi:hypothetical protein